MTDQQKAQDAFMRELDVLIYRFIENWDLSLASAIGVLELRKMQLFQRELEAQEGGE